jgi:hypothetical protein
MGFDQCHEPCRRRAPAQDSIAHFAQRVGACADAFADAYSDAWVMSSERLIVDLVERHWDGLDAVLMWARCVQSPTPSAIGELRAG